MPIFAVIEGLNNKVKDLTCELGRWLWLVRCLFESGSPEPHELCVVGDMPLEPQHFEGIHRSVSQQSQIMSSRNRGTLCAKI